MSRRAYRATRVNDVDWDQIARGKEGLGVTLGVEPDAHRSVAVGTIDFPRTRPRDKWSHRRAGNKNPNRCRSGDQERCRIRDRSQIKRKTAKSRFRRALHAVWEWCWKHLHQPVREQHR